MPHARRQARGLLKWSKAGMYALEPSPASLPPWETTYRGSSDRCPRDSQTDEPRTSAALIRSCGFRTNKRLMKFFAFGLMPDHAS